MNCKPGDLARIIDHPDARRAGIVDRMIRVVELDGFSADGSPAWSYQGPPFVIYGGVATITRIADYLLRPIGNPGEDEQDETLSWKPVPLPEIVPALMDGEAVHG